MSDEQEIKPSASEQKKEDWMNAKWRPMMGWMYMGVCVFDFVMAPILWTAIQALYHGGINTQWQPLTLQGGGLFHVAMGAVIGISAYGRTKEKLEGVAGGGQPMGTQYIPPGGMQGGMGMNNGMGGGFGGQSSGGFGGQSSGGFGGQSSGGFGGQSSGGFGNGNTTASTTGFSSGATTSSVPSTGFGSPASGFGSATSAPASGGFGSAASTVSTGFGGKLAPPPAVQPLQ